ncbi:uncharacterized protein DS421_11g339920 [Arachis hypogaea]|nr:uncharacterized protein DS421_11g339920 [Arachis hypogaea]
MSPKEIAAGGCVVGEDRHWRRYRRRRSLLEDIVTGGECKRRSPLEKLSLEEMSPEKIVRWRTQDVIPSFQRMPLRRSSENAAEKIVTGAVIGAVAGEDRNTDRRFGFQSLESATAKIARAASLF